MVDLLFTAHNRRAFTEASFAALLEHTDWTLVSHLIVLDDDSIDGTAEWLAAETSDFYGRTGQVCDYQTARFGGPVAMLNRALSIGGAPLIAKVDNDVIVCPGWLETMVGVLDAAPELDALGMEPGFASPVVPLDEPRGYKPAPHIGGVGVFRRRVFRHRPRGHDRFFGMTEHWQRFAVCGWVDPDLPVFLLDHCPVEPWRSLAAEYVARGWSRPWPLYDEAMSGYWSWFTERAAAA